MATAAAIRHVEMDGDPAELGRAGPIDPTVMYGMDLDNQGNIKGCITCMFIWTFMQH